MSEELTQVGTVLCYQTFGHLVVHSFTPGYKKLMLTVPLPGIFLSHVLDTCGLYLNYILITWLNTKHNLMEKVIFTKHKCMYTGFSLEISEW